MPATTYSPPCVARAPSPARKLIVAVWAERHGLHVHSSQTNPPTFRKLPANGARGRAPHTRPHRPPHKPYTRLMSNTGLAKYRYRRRLPHLQKADCDLFVTFCTARRVLPLEARDIVLEHCLREGGMLPFADDTAKAAGGGARATPTLRATPAGATPACATPARAIRKPRIQLHAVVVMPDHVHLLLRPLRDECGWPSR